MSNSNDFLSWKLDPEVSFSDWKIELLVDDKFEGKFHVHRPILAVGRRSSKYFHCLFSQNFQESSTKTSVIKLDHGISVNAFPQLLDYLYNLPLQVDTESATSLHSLSQYFEIEQLKLGVTNFLENDINMNNFTTYYHHAKLLHDDAVLNKVLTFCWKNLDDIYKKRDLAQSLNPELWLEVFEKIRYIFVEGYSKSASMAVAWSLKGFEKTTDKVMFEKLTQKRFLPHIHPRSACKLMEMELKLCAPPENDQCTSLQERCIYSLAKKWKSIDYARIERLSKQNYLIGARLLQKVSMEAQDKLIPPPIEEGPANFDFSVGKSEPLPASPFGKSTFKPSESHADGPFRFGKLVPSTSEISGEQQTK